MKRYRPVFYLEICCLGSAYAIAVTLVLCLYAAVRLCYPALIAWREDPALVPDGDSQFIIPPIPSSLESTNAPPTEPTPEELEHSRQLRLAQQKQEYAKALIRARKQALQDLALALCIQGVAWPFFVIHWRFLRSFPETDLEDQPSSSST